MSKSNVNNNDKNNAKKGVKPVNAWNEAITDAKKMQQEAKMQLIRLKQAVKAFERLRDNGVPFPGENSTTESGAKA
ncbi:MAG TPA: hypothetical protein VF544_17810 [Pyrinomonadaceae bacterium]